MVDSDVTVVGARKLVSSGHAVSLHGLGVGPIPRVPAKDVI